MTAAGAVSSCVRRARRGRGVLATGEIVVIAASVGIATLAAAAAGGTPGTDGQAQTIALTVALLAGFAWGSERSTDARSVARAMDRRFGLSGALLTAFESESGGSTSPVASLLAREIAPLVSANRFVVDSARSSALLLAAPFVSLALWNLATEVREAPAVARVGSTSTAGAISTLVGGEALGSEAARLASIPGLAPSVVEKLRALEADALSSRVRTGAASDVDRAAAERELASRLAALQRQVRSPGMTPGAREGTMEGPDARIEPPPGASMDKTRPPDSDSASAPGSDVTSTGADPAAGQERAVFSPRWWPARYDPVVERWLQAEPTTRGGRPR